MCWNQDISFSLQWSINYGIQIYHHLVPKQVFLNDLFDTFFFLFWVVSFFILRPNKETLLYKELLYIKLVLISSACNVKILQLKKYNAERLAILLEGASYFFNIPSILNYILTRITRYILTRINRIFKPSGRLGFSTTETTLSMCLKIQG